MRGDRDLDPTPAIEAARETAVLQLQSMFPGTVETNEELAVAVGVASKLFASIESTRTRARFLQGNDALTLLDGIFDPENAAARAGFEAGIEALLPDVRNRSELLEKRRVGRHFPTVLSEVSLFRQRNGAIWAIAQARPAPTSR